MPMPPNGLCEYVACTPPDAGGCCQHSRVVPGCQCSPDRCRAQKGDSVRKRSENTDIVTKKKEAYNQTNSQRRAKLIETGKSLRSRNRSDLPLDHHVTEPHVRVSQDRTLASESSPRPQSTATSFLPEGSPGGSRCGRSGSRGWRTRINQAEISRGAAVCSAEAS
jgi:hypothetical protein